MGQITTCTNKMSHPRFDHKLKGDRIVIRLIDTTLHPDTFDLHEHGQP